MLPRRATARKRRRETATPTFISQRRDCRGASRIELEDAFRTLRPSDRAVLLLVGVLDFDYEAAAAVLGVPRGTLAWRLSAARERFRDALEAERWLTTSLLREAADRLLPTEPPSFFEDFWEGAERREHVDAVRRWRRSPSPLLAVRCARSAAAGVIAAPFGVARRRRPDADVLDADASGVSHVRSSQRARHGPRQLRTSARQTAAQVIFTTGADRFYGTKLLHSTRR